LGLALGIYSKQLAAVGLVLNLFILAVSVLSNLVFVKAISGIRITEEDNLKALTVSNLQNVLHIRSAFATEQQNESTLKQAETTSKTQITTWMMQTFIFQLTWIIYLFTLVIVGYYLFELLRKGDLNVPNSIALMAIFVEGSGRLLFMGGRISRFFEKKADVKDMYKFIRDFGKQTYPVLEDSSFKKL
jgi:ABC-type multidrug transport system fused ATPase/permease subunit